MNPLILLKIGRKEYPITEKDKFLDNGACVTLLTQHGPWGEWSYTVPILSQKAIREIGKFEHVPLPHNYGASCKLFSLKPKTE